MSMIVLLSKLIILSKIIILKNNEMKLKNRKVDYDYLL